MEQETTADGRPLTAEEETADGRPPPTDNRPQPEETAVGNLPLTVNDQRSAVGGQPSSEESGIVRAAAVLAAGNVVSRVLGLAREMVKANLFGTTPLLAAFQACLLYTSPSPRD